VAATRAKEAAELLPQCDDAAPAVPGAWTVKDHLAHMAAWREHAAHLLAPGGRAEAMAEGRNLEERNAAIHEATRGLSAGAVAESVRTSWEVLAAAIEACSEEDLRAPRPNDPERQVWEVIPGNTHGHLAEHLEYLASGRGDEPAAEAVALWVHDLDNQSFADDRTRGSADYNLGCFYARRGRVEDAFPYLRRGLELNPGLREWAREDRDLDPIRRAAMVAALLG